MKIGLEIITLMGAATFQVFDLEDAQDVTAFNHLISCKV